MYCITITSRTKQTKQVDLTGVNRTKTEQIIHTVEKLKLKNERKRMNINILSIFFPFIYIYFLIYINKGARVDVGPISQQPPEMQRRWYKAHAARAVENQPINRLIIIERLKIGYAHNIERRNHEFLSNY